MSNSNNYITSAEYESGVGVLKIYSDSISPALKIKETPSSTLTISASNASSNLQVGDSGVTNALQVNSVWLSDLEIEIGTTATLPAGSAATVINTGTSKKAILNFGIPKGDTGATPEMTWGSITGTLSNQTDLQAALNTKQPNLTSANAGTGIAITGSGSNVIISNTQTSAVWGNIQGTLSNQTDLQNALNGKQGIISDLSDIRSNATNGQSAYTTIQTYGNIVTHNANEFASSTQGALADTAIQPNDNITELNNNAGYITKAVNNLDNYMLTTDINTALGNKASSSALTTEINNRISADSTLQDEIDSVAEVVGTKVTKNADITSATKCKITYDNKGLVTGGADLISSDIPNLHLSKISDVTASAQEVNYLSGTTSNVQQQINGKLNTSDVINNVTTTTTNQALSANMGKELQDQITNLKQRGRYLSIWNCPAGLATTTPTVNPYTYKAGDYFIVGIVGTVGLTNYKPNGATYNKDVPSTTVETGDVQVNDTYYFDGTSWSLLHTEQPTVAFSTLAGSPYDNSNLTSALNAKVTGNSDIAGATKCKITYDSKGLVTGGTDLTASDIPNLTLSKITDVTATATELNYCDGVTSSIQTQLDNRAEVFFVDYP